MLPNLHRHGLLPALWGGKQLSSGKHRPSNSKNLRGYLSMRWQHQGAHYRENSEFCGKKSLQGKIREFGKMGKIREFYKNMSGKYQGIFSYIYILIVSPFSRIYISWKMGKLSGKNQGICFTKLNGHPATCILGLLTSCHSLAPVAKISDTVR